MKNFFAVFILFLGIPFLVGAEEAVITTLRGSVSVRAAASKKWKPATPGQKLKKNDQIKTGPSALVQVDVGSRATLLVKENSRLSFQRDRRGQLVSFQIGEFLVGLKKKLQGQERFRVRTPVAVAAVRGTVFWGKSDELKKTSYACFTGSIEVWGQRRHVVLEPGQMTSVLPNQSPQTPEPNTIPGDYVDTFKIDGSLGGIEQLLTP